MATDPYLTTPVGSLAAVTDETTDEAYTQSISALPKLLLDMVSSERTGAFIVGIAKTHSIPLSRAPRIAFAVLRVAIGKVALAQLGSILSSELKLANDAAQKLAQELEHDLFAPVAGELSAYLEIRNREIKKIENKATGNPRAAGASNVLDLKDSQAQKRLVPPPVRRSNS